MKFRNEKNSISRSVENLSQKKSRLQNNVYNSVSWWKSTSGDVFRDEWKDIELLMRKVDQNVNESLASIKKLERIMEEVDEERRRQLQKENQQKKN